MAAKVKNRRRSALVRALHSRLFHKRIKPAKNKYSRKGKKRDRKGDD